MKKLFLLALSVAALANTGMAQSSAQAHSQQTATQQNIDKMEVNGMPISVYAKSETDQWTKNLGLNKSQSGKLLEINKQLAVKRSNAERTDRASSIKANDEIAKERNEQYQTVLTKEQYLKFQSMTAQFSSKAR